MISRLEIGYTFTHFYHLACRFMAKCHGHWAGAVAIYDREI
ncbi:hypothetical protein AAC03nite_23030 [Alicyclobacillus acidoterrestris]|nr:hypothetical protein AAC03nite_23030 [Alicyclobacillus acidoterrestris]